MWSLAIMFCLTLNGAPETPFTSDWGSLTEYSKIYEDPSGQNGLEEILTPEIQKQFSKAIFNDSMVGLSTSHWWVQMDLPVSLSEPGPRILVFFASYLDSVDVYIEPGLPLERHIKLGDTLPFAQRPLGTVQLAVPLEFKKDGPTKVYLRIHSDGNVNLLTSLIGEEELRRDSRSVALFVSSFLGFVAALIFYHFFFFLSTRYTGYLYFCIWSFALCGVMTIISGQGFEWFWPDSPGINNRAPFFSLLMSYGFVAFSRETLTSNVHLPKADRIGYYVQIGLAGLTLVSLFSPLYVGARLSNFSLMGWMWCLGVAVPIAIKGYRPAWFYLASFGLVAVFFINGWMHWMGLSDQSFRLISVSQSIVFTLIAMLSMGLSSFALAEHFNLMKRERQEALDLSLKMEQAHASDLEVEVENKTLELRRANRDLKAADARKTSFFRSISHELRTPLTLILNPLDEEKKLSPDNANLQVASKHALRLLRLVNQLLDFQKLSAGRMNLEIRPINLQDFLRFCVEGVSSAASAREIEFQSLLNQEPLYIAGNLDALEKVVFNLLSNALKYTPAGGVIRLRLVDDEAMVRIEVEDTGIGISPERLNTVFDIFSESTVGTSRHEEGSGLGLALVKEMTESMDGEVGVRSVIDTGSCFWVQFTKIREPLNPTAETFSIKNWLMADLLPTSRSQLIHQDQSFQGEQRTESNYKVLVVDDIDDMRALLRSLMEREGHQVYEACHGRDGLEKAEELAPDLIISDWMMPEMSGPEMIQAFGQNPALSSIPVILLTARGDDDSKLLGTQAGAAGFLSKPFSSLEVVSLVRNLLQLKEREREVDDLNKHLTENVLKRYLPEDLVDQIVAGDVSIDEKPRTYVGTVLFSDLQGFTQLANEIPAATLARLLNCYFEEMVNIVFQFGGTLDKFIGDAMMILFGVPVEMPPTQQVRHAADCALAMQRSMRKLDAMWRAEGIEPLRMRIGMHQGSMIVGNFGSKRRADYTAIGPAVNLAARLETSCPPGEVLISRDIATLLQEDEFKDAGSFTLKGFTDPVRCYRLLDTNTEES